MNNNNRNIIARDTALKSVSPPINLAPATVSFSTYGHLLITGSEDMIRLAAEKLPSLPSVTLLVTDSIQNMDEDHLEKALAAAQDKTIYQATIKSVKGFLGQFQVTIEQNGETGEFSKIAQNRPFFDLILNLGSDDLFQTELAPAGYFHVDPNSPELANALEELPEYIGEFEKPRYFQINNDICAHSNRGLTGCTRCLDVCPADAISSDNIEVSINPHMCHGAGGCATACPTGAISYALPQPMRLHEYLQRTLEEYRTQNGSNPVVLFHDKEQPAPQDLPGHIIPVQLEEVAAAGQETWLTCLASGASQVLLFTENHLPESISELLNKEIKLTQQILSGLALRSSSVQLINAEQLTAIADEAEPLVTQPMATVNSSNKREVLFKAIDHLAANSEQQHPDYLALPAGSPFGQVTLSQNDCTLCMSCVAVCPTQALTDGGEKPALNFLEQNCVQCGLCESACPEKVVSYNPRLLLTEQRSVSVEIHSEAPFECISCGKPFAPRSTVEKMIEKLSGHRLFEGPAINRLKMCEDCRVQDIYTDLTAHPEKQLEL
jgi:ferredoxin